MEFTIEGETTASAERVWAVMTDVERWPEWTASVLSVQLLERGPLRVGSRACIRQPRFRPAVWQVTQLEPGRGFTWVYRGLGVAATAGHQVQPAPGGGCRYRLWVRYDGPLGWLLGRAIAGMTRQYLQLEAEGLGRYAEAGGGQGNVPGERLGSPPP